MTRPILHGALRRSAPPRSRRIAHRSTRIAALPAALLAMLLAACAAGPDYRRPDAPLPAAFTEGGVTWSRAQPDDARPRGAWWRDFADPTLDELMARIDAGNFDLRAAEARFRQAEALTRQARAARWPVLGASAGLSRGGTGAIGTGTGIASSAGRTSTTASIGASLSWEADLWGGLARGVEANAASAQASGADLVNTRLSLQATLAQTYVSLRLAEAQQALLTGAVTAYERSLQLTERRYAAGVAGRVDVTQAQTQLETARAQAIDVGIQRAQYAHAIAVLVGRPASAFTVPPRALPEVDLTVAPAAVAGVTPGAAPGTAAGAPAGTGPAPAGPGALPGDAAALPALPIVAPTLPSELLQRRPDVAGGERRVAAANARIGVAAAAFFPSLSLSGSLGQRAGSVASLFDAANRVWSIGPSLAATLFDAGARSAARAQAEAAYDEAVATYRGIVLTAVQETEDALVALRLLEQEATANAAAVAAATENLRITTEQYRAGTVSYLNVITAQTAALTSRRSQLELRGRQLTAAVQLYRAIGGGWNGVDLPVLATAAPEAATTATNATNAAGAAGAAPVAAPAGEPRAGAPDAPARLVR